MLNRLVVDLPTVISQQNGNPAITAPSVLSRQFDHVRHKSFFIRTALWPVSLWRSMLAKDEANTTFRHIHLARQLIDTSGDARGLEVSPGGLSQDQLIQGQTRYGASEPFVLLLKTLQFLELSSPHATLLLAITIKGLFRNPNFPDPIYTRHSLTDNSPNLSQLRDNLFRFVSFVRHL